MNEKTRRNSPFSPAFPVPKITVDNVEPDEQITNQKPYQTSHSLNVPKQGSLAVSNDRLGSFSPASSPERRRSSIRSVISILIGNEHHIVEEAPLFKERFPGCWIFGHGTIVNMPIEFGNPFLVSTFLGRLVKMNFILCCSRAFCVIFPVASESMHKFLYVKDHRWSPLWLSLISFILLVTIINMRFTEKYIRLTPINIVILVMTEVSLTFLLIFLSLASEYGIQLWYISLDLFHDLEHDGFSPYALEYWPELHLTPALFVVIAHLQKMTNLVTIYVMNRFTKVTYTSRTVYYVIVFQTFFSTALAITIFKNYTYGVSSFWDNTQLFIASTWALCMSLLYVHYLNRLVEGKIIRLSGMTWHDLVSGSLRILYF